MEIELADTEAFNPEEKIVLDEVRILSPGRFILLYFLTLSLYSVWWIYKAWRFFKQKEGSDILPAVRTIFSIFYLIPLLKRILKFAQSKGYSEQYYPIVLYIGIIGFNLTSRLPEPYFLISFLAAIFFIPPLTAFNYGLLNSTEFEIKKVSSFEARHIVLMVIGGIMWFFILLGLFLGDV